MANVLARDLQEDPKLFAKINLNFRRNKKQDHTQLLDTEAANFQFSRDRETYWNPSEFSLLYGTELWNQADETQRLRLNQLYWVAYYSQIISAEIATIFFNQTSATGLYGLEDFRLVCDMLDLESAQERAHIAAFKKVGETFEREIFEKRLFTYPMRGPFRETMIYQKSNRIQKFWRNLQLRAYSLLSSGNAFIACQYFTVRGLRTLNGKLIQHRLSDFYLKNRNAENIPSPAKISYYHFMDESFHFNSSSILSHDVLKCLRPPTKFEQKISNLAIRGCQKDHFHFSTTINGIFWDDRALFPVVDELLQSSVFHLSPEESKQMMYACYTKENEGSVNSYDTQQIALESYKNYLADMEYVDQENKELKVMSKSNLSEHLKRNRMGLDRYFSQKKGT